MFQFEKTPGGYYRCFDQSGTLYESERIGIIYELTEPPLLATLHKIGEHSAVEKLYFDRFVPKNKEHPELFDFRLITSRLWDAVDLNKFVNTTGYFGMWLKSNDLLFEDFKQKG